MQLVVAGRKALDRGYRTPLERRDRYPAGRRGVAVQVHDTGAAQAEATAVPGAGESQVVAKVPEERCVVVAIEGHQGKT